MQAHGTVDVSREAPAAAVPGIDLVSLRPRLIRYARHLVGDSHEAEDLVQETLIAAFQSASGFRGQAHFDTWAIAMASRCACIVLALETVRLQANP